MNLTLCNTNLKMLKRTKFHLCRGRLFNLWSSPVLWIRIDSARNLDRFELSKSWNCYRILARYRLLYIQYSVVIIVGYCLVYFVAVLCFLFYCHVVFH